MASDQERIEREVKEAQQRADDALQREQQALAELNLQAAEAWMEEAMNE